MKIKISKFKIALIILVFIIVVLFVYLFFKYENERKNTISGFTGYSSSTMHNGMITTEIIEVEDKWHYTIDYTGDHTVITDYIFKVDDHHYVFLLRFIDDKGKVLHLPHEVHAINTVKILVDKTREFQSVSYLQLSSLTTTEKEEWITFLKSIAGYDSDTQIQTVIQFLEE